MKKTTKYLTFIILTFCTLFIGMNGVKAGFDIGSDVTLQDKIHSEFNSEIGPSQGVSASEGYDGCLGGMSILGIRVTIVGADGVIANGTTPVNYTSQSTSGTYKTDIINKNGELSTVSIKNMGTSVYGKYVWVGNVGNWANGIDPTDQIYEDIVNDLNNNKVPKVFSDTGFCKKHDECIRKVDERKENKLDYHVLIEPVIRMTLPKTIVINNFSFNVIGEGFLSMLTGKYTYKGYTCSDIKSYTGTATEVAKKIEGLDLRSMKDLYDEIGETDLGSHSINTNNYADKIKELRDNYPKRTFTNPKGFGYWVASTAAKSGILGGLGAKSIHLTTADAMNYNLNSGGTKYNASLQNIAPNLQSLYQKQGGVPQGYAMGIIWFWAIQEKLDKECNPEDIKPGSKFDDACCSDEDYVKKYYEINPESKFMEACCSDTKFLNTYYSLKPDDKELYCCEDDVFLNKYKTIVTGNEYKENLNKYCGEDACKYEVGEPFRNDCCEETKYITDYVILNNIIDTEQFLIDNCGKKLEEIPALECNPTYKDASCYSPYDQAKYKDCAAVDSVPSSYIDDVSTTQSDEQWEKWSSYFFRSDSSETNGEYIDNSMGNEYCPYYCQEIVESDYGNVPLVHVSTDKLEVGKTPDLLAGTYFTWKLKFKGMKECRAIIDWEKIQADLALNSAEIEYEYENWTSRSTGHCNIGGLPDEYANAREYRYSWTNCDESVNSTYGLYNKYSLHGSVMNATRDTPLTSYVTYCYSVSGIAYESSTLAGANLWFSHCGYSGDRSRPIMLEYFNKRKAIVAKINQCLGTDGAVEYNLDPEVEVNYSMKDSTGAISEQGPIDMESNKKVIESGSWIDEKSIWEADKTNLEYVIEAEALKEKLLALQRMEAAEETMYEKCKTIYCSSGFSYGFPHMDISGLDYNSKWQSLANLVNECQSIATDLGKPFPTYTVGYGGAMVGGITYTYTQNPWEEFNTQRYAVCQNVQVDNSIDMNKIKNCSQQGINIDNYCIGDDYRLENFFGDTFKTYNELLNDEEVLYARKIKEMLESQPFGDVPYTIFAGAETYGGEDAKNKSNGKYQIREHLNWDGGADGNRQMNVFGGYTNYIIPAKYYEDIFYNSDEIRDLNPKIDFDSKYERVTKYSIVEIDYEIPNDVNNIVEADGTVHSGNASDYKNAIDIGGNFTVPFMTETSAGGVYDFVVSYTHIGEDGHFDKLMDKDEYDDYACKFDVKNKIIKEGPCEGPECVLDTGMGGLNVIYRPIDLDNPFPGIDNSCRDTGSNWCVWHFSSLSQLGYRLTCDILEENSDYYGYYTGNCACDNEKVQLIITNNRKVHTTQIYNLDPLYTITLSPSAIKQIRASNKKINNDYPTTDTLYCADGVSNCYSSFINEFSKTDTNGTSIIDCNSEELSFNGCDWEGEG